MTNVTPLHRPVLSPFDEARRQIDEWEKFDPQARHIVLILDGAEEVVTTVTGEVRKSEAAGLCLVASHLMVED